jgi:Bax protein
MKQTPGALRQRAHVWAVALALAVGGWFAVHEVASQPAPSPVAQGSFVPAGPPRPAAAVPPVVAVSVIDAAGALPSLLDRASLADLASIDPESRLFHHVQVTSAAALGDLIGRLGAVTGGPDNVSAASLPGDLESVPAPRRKELFLGALMPLVAFCNSTVQAQRQRLAAISPATPPDVAERAFLVALGDYYRLDRSSRALLTLADTLQALRERVDEIPPSLILAQAALESGWGVALPSQRTNNLFGEQTTGALTTPMYGTAGGVGRSRLAAFPTIGASVESYMRNLNSHPAYDEFRWRRRLQRCRGQGQLDPLSLAASLEPYSSRGRDYADALVRFIMSNGLQRYDLAAAAGWQSMPA